MSHYIPKFTKYILSGIALYLIIDYLSIFLPANTTNLNQLARFLILAFSILFIAFQLANFLGTISENSIDNFTELSYIKLNKGNEKEIKAAKCANQNYILKAIGGFVTTLFFGVLSKIIVYYITKR